MKKKFLNVDCIIKIFYYFKINVKLNNLVLNKKKKKLLSTYVLQILFFYLQM